MAWNRFKKAPSKSPPKKDWSYEEMKIVGWCLNKKISIGISPDWKHDLIYWQIDITINSKTHTDPNRYHDRDIHNKVVEYYKYYYDKYNINTNNNG